MMTKTVTVMMVQLDDGGSIKLTLIKIKNRLLRVRVYFKACLFIVFCKLLMVVTF